MSKLFCVMFVSHMDHDNKLLDVIQQCIKLRSQEAINLQVCFSFTTKLLGII